MYLGKLWVLTSHWLALILYWNQQIYSSKLYLNGKTIVYLQYLLKKFKHITPCHTNLVWGRSIAWDQKIQNWAHFEHEEYWQNSVAWFAPIYPCQSPLLRPQLNMCNIDTNIEPVGLVVLSHYLQISFLHWSITDLDLTSKC